MSDQDTTMPGSRIGGQGEMGGGMGESPQIGYGGNEGNVVGSGTKDTLDDDNDMGGGSAGRSNDDYGTDAEDDEDTDEP